MREEGGRGRRKEGKEEEGRGGEGRREKWQGREEGG